MSDDCFRGAHRAAELAGLSFPITFLPVNKQPPPRPPSGDVDAAASVPASRRPLTLSAGARDRMRRAMPEGQFCASAGRRCGRTA
ncbi:hypothetical protein GA0070563_12617 [Micromonospora carbonacea]|uniref:Uncharacterized protein n=1 Tax=Micromonospora carbonacea TaxID=47853 RepID=A0A1C5AXT1_9ACTN|nr:hypothetical protein GA0070563_12617 [Micromonospora carbonacea]